MGYQALLFCPDEKTARTVSQVLTELDFSIVPCTEPFAAVKKLMAEHFDAVVVDCDNEQNATLLFKSARNSTANQSALAVAVVEGQAGVAKAFRIGANLVLTKPINVEQAKGTLRVARGLLRKGEPGRPATPATPTPASTPAPAKPISSVVSAVQNAPKSLTSSTLPPRPVPTAPSPATASSSPVQPKIAVTSPVVKASTPEPPIEVEIEPDDDVLDSSVAPEVAAAPSMAQPPKVEPRVSSAGLGRALAGGAASAPAPAREPQQAKIPAEIAPAAVEPKTVESKTEEKAASFGGDSALPAPTFTFGGAVEDGASSAGGSKKAILAIAAIAIVAVAGYLGYSQFYGKATAHGTTGATAPAVQPVNTASTPTAPPATPAAAPKDAQPSASAASQPASTENTETASVSSKSTPASHPTKPATKAAEPAATEKAAASKPAAAEKVVAEKAEAEPIVVKSDLSRKPAAKPVSAPDAPAPGLIGVAPTVTSPLPNLATGASAPKPMLQTMNVSQGVSQGLLYKKVQPMYPSSALRMHVEGAVQLLATISKDGDITSVKVLNGDQALAKSASDAVKQWKYKPYLLNGEPVEIQTQITVNFKLPR